MPNRSNTANFVGFVPFFAVLCWTAAAAAHHPGGGSSLGADGNVGALTTGRLVASPRSRWSLLTRYVKLVDVAPSYLVPLGTRGDHVGLLEPGYFHAFSDRVAMNVAVPVVLRAPEADVSIDGDPSEAEVGLGDVRLGTRWVLWLSAQRSASLAAAMDLTFPTGGVRDRPLPPAQPAFGPGPSSTSGEEARFGAGDFLGRVSGSFRWLPAPTWSVSADVGVTTALDEDTNVTLDYGGGALWRPIPALGVFLDVGARTFLRTEDFGLSALQSQPREAGDAIVLVTPGLTLSPTPDVVIAVGPQLPVTSVKDFDIAVNAALTVVLPE